MIDSELFRRVINVENYSVEELVVYLFLTYIRLEKDILVNNILEYIDKNISSEIKEFIYINFNKNRYEVIDREIINNFDKESILNTIIYIDRYIQPKVSCQVTMNERNPESVTTLALKTVDVSKVNSAIEFYSGIGSNIIRMADKGIKKITAIEPYKNMYVILMIRTDLYKLKNKGYEIELINNFEFEFSKENPNAKYDLVTMQQPWRDERIREQIAYLKPDFLKDMTNVRDTNWYYIYLAMQHLSNDGKAIMLVTESIENGYLDKEIRRKTIENGYIEKIIELPSRLLNCTSLSSLLMVLSFKNDNIEFIDATDSYSQNGRVKYLSDDDINKILNKNNPYRYIIDNCEVVNNDRLVPSYYGISDIENSIELSKIANIIRGQNYRRSDLDSIITQNKTSYELIRTSHLEDGFVNDFEYLLELPGRYEELVDEDILITRVGSNRSVAIYKKGNEGKAIVEQSLLVIRVDKEKVNPYYILAYMMSDLGKEQLSAAYSGTGISQISLNNLKKVKVPIIDKEKEEIIVKSIKTKLKEINNRKKELSSLIKEMDKDIDEWFLKGKINEK